MDILASSMMFADLLGIYGKFGRHDTFNRDFLNFIINIHANYGCEGNDFNEKSWDTMHLLSGFTLGVFGLEMESAYNFLQYWETIEPGLVSIGLSSYQGRNLFEGGQMGIDRDMAYGMLGWLSGKSIWF